MTARTAHAAALAALVAAVLATFWPVLSASFLPWDDDRNFVHNVYYRGIGLAEARWAFTTARTGHYIPVTWLTLGLDYELFGMDARGYHLSSLLFHLANALLCYRLMIRIAGRAYPSVAGAPALAAAGLAGALAFAVHPLRAESVAWISERRDVVSGLFCLLAANAYLGVLEPSRRRRARTLSFLFFIGALLSKGTAMALPIGLLALDIAFGRLPLSPVAWARREHRDAILEKAPFLLASAASAVMSLGMASHAMWSLAQMTAAQRIAALFFGLSYYLEKTVWPVDLAILVPMPAGFGLMRSDVIVRALGLLVLAMLLFLGRRIPALPAAAVAYAVFVLPVSGIVQAGPQLVASRYSYLSCIPWALVFAGALARAAETTSRRSRAVMLLAVLAPVALLAPLCHREVEHWRDGWALWSEAVRDAPTGSLPRYGLAFMHMRAGRWAEARLELAIGLRHEPRARNLRTLQSIILSSCPDERLRDPRKALDLAAAVAREEGSRNSWSLWTLAAAQAACGDFDRALTTARGAREEAMRRDISELVSLLDSAIPLFESRRPYRLDGRDQYPSRAPLQAHGWPVPDPG